MSHALSQKGKNTDLDKYADIINPFPIFWYISNKMQRYTVHLFLETSLHASGGISTNHQEHTTVSTESDTCQPLLLPAAIVEELQLQFQLLHDNGR